MVASLCLFDPIWIWFLSRFAGTFWQSLCHCLLSVSETYTCVILNNVYPLGASSSQASRSALAASASAWFIFASSWIQQTKHRFGLVTWFKVRVQECSREHWNLFRICCFRIWPWCLAYKAVWPWDRLHTGCDTSAADTPLPKLLKTSPSFCCHSALVCCPFQKHTWVILNNVYPLGPPLSTSLGVCFGSISISIIHLRILLNPTNKT